MFYEKISQLCLMRGISLTEFTNQIGASQSNVTAWKKIEKPRAKTLKAAADFFGVSISYFLDEAQQLEDGAHFERAEVRVYPAPASDKTKSILYDRLYDLCLRRGFSISRLPEYIDGLDVKPSSINGWKHGSQPRQDKIKKIADFFNVPVSYFYEDDSTGAENKKSTPEELELSEGERGLILLFRQLPEEKRVLALEMIRVALGTK